MEMPKHLYMSRIMRPTILLYNSIHLEAFPKVCGNPHISHERKIGQKDFQF